MIFNYLIRFSSVKHIVTKAMFEIVRKFSQFFTIDNVDLYIHIDSNGGQRKNVMKFL